MERRKFVQSSAIFSIAMSSGVSISASQFDEAKFEKIKQRELGFLEAEITDAFRQHECSQEHASTFITPVNVLKRSLKGDQFYFRYQNANNETITISHVEGQTLMKLGEDFS